MNSKPIEQFSINNNQGQGFVEFILLIGMLVILAFIILQLFNSNIGDLWVNAVKIIAYPNTNVSLP